MTDEQHVTDLIPAYTLGILDSAEAGRVALHLEGCADCQAELRLYQPVTEALALSAQERMPPARLKTRLMESVQASRPVAQVNWLERLFQVRWQRVPAWGLVSLLLIVALAATNVYLWAQSRPAHLRTVAMSGTEAVPGASGMLVFSEDGQSGTLVVDGLPALGEDQQYQLWLIQDGQRTSGGVFSVAQDGYGSLSIQAPQPLSAYQAFGVTIEPYGGSPGPTGQKVLGGES